MNSVPETPESWPTTAETRAVARTRGSRRRAIIAATTAGALALGAGSAVAVSNAYKTVTLDIDGEERDVSTFAGDVDGLLDEEGITVSERDVVAPGVGAALESGSDVVIRTAKKLDIQVDDKKSSAWIAAADAQEALAMLNQRGSDVALVASRSADRAEIPIDLHQGEAVAVVHDGEVDVVDGSDQVDDVLATADVALDGDDLVTVTDIASAGVKAEDLPDDAEMPHVAAVVERVEVEEVTRTVTIEHETQVKKDSDRYEDLDPKVAEEGRDGTRKVVREVTTIDGKEVSSEKISEKVTKKPVTRVVVEGTKERPEPEPEPATSSGSSSSSSSSGSSSTTSYSGSNRQIGQQMAAARGWTGSQWTCLESLWTKESNWSHTAANPSSGAYGIPQSLPGSKMATAGSDWQTNPATQIQWGLDYIAGRYGTPCGAWSHSQANNWY